MKTIAGFVTINPTKDSFIVGRDWLFIIVLAITSLAMNNFTYSNTKSIILQILLSGSIFLLYKKRPSMIFVAVILLSILPMMMYGGFLLSEVGGYYSLNGKISILLSFILIIYGIFVVKHNYKIQLPTLLFSLIMATSAIWTISILSYSEAFWWMCIAYVVLPFFIREDYDVRLILLTYIIAVDLFCAKLIMFNIQNTDVFRGTTSLNSNYAALFVILGLTVLVVTYIQYKTILPIALKILFLPSMVLSVIALTYIASRSSIVMLGIVLVLFLSYEFKYRSVLIWSALSYALLGVLYQRGYFDVLLLRFESADIMSGGGRFTIQQGILSVVANSNLFNILFGYGYLTSSNFNLVSVQAHNSYVSILIGFGIIGLLSYGFYLLKICIHLFHSQYKPFLILFVVLCFYGFAIEPFHIMTCIVIFCLLSGISNIAVKNLPNKDQQLQRKFGDIL